MKKSITDATFSLCLCSKTMWTAILKTVDVTRNNAVLGFPASIRYFRNEASAFILLYFAAAHGTAVKSKIKRTQIRWHGRTQTGCVNQMPQPGPKKLARRTDWQTGTVTDWRNDSRTEQQTFSAFLQAILTLRNVALWVLRAFFPGCVTPRFAFSGSNIIITAQKKATAVPWHKDPRARCHKPLGQEQGLLLPERLSWNVANQRCYLPHLLLVPVVNDDEGDR